MLEAVSNRPGVSQRQRAGRLGVALGATNLLIRRLAPTDYDLVVIATTTDASECLAGLVRAGVGEDRMVALMDRPAVGLTRLPEMD